jgi:hypothetical protein
MFLVAQGHSTAGWQKWRLAIGVNLIWKGKTTFIQNASRTDSPSPAHGGSAVHAEVKKYAARKIGGTIYKNQK